MGSSSVWFIGSGKLPVAAVWRMVCRDCCVRVTEDELGQPPLRGRDGLSEGHDHEKLVKGWRRMFWRRKERSIGGSWRSRC